MIMDECGFEETFSKDFKKQQNRYSLKYYGLILPVVLVFVLYISFQYYDGALFFKLILPVSTALIGLYLLILDIQNRDFLARCYKLTKHGIIWKGRWDKERLIPWSSVVAVDTGTLSAYDGHSIVVIRCFLSTAAWWKTTPNLHHSGNEDTIRTYYKFRKECFVLEYSAKREQTIMSLWTNVHKDNYSNLMESEDTVVLNGDFEYIFDEKTRSICLPLKNVLLIYIVFVVIVILIGQLLEYLINGKITSLLDGISDEEALGIVFLLMLPFFVLARLKGERKSRSWLLGTCKLSKDGIFLKQLQKDTEFVPWSSIVAVERKQMNLDRSVHISVICCYRSLTGKALLEHTPKQAIKNPLYKEYYRLWDEVITIGYTKERMAKIRAARGTIIQRK